MARRPGLGRGLDALIPGNEDQPGQKPAASGQGITANSNRADTTQSPAAQK